MERIRFIPAQVKTFPCERPDACERCESPILTQRGTADKTVRDLYSTAAWSFCGWSGWFETATRVFAARAWIWSGSGGRCYAAVGGGAFRGRTTRRSARQGEAR